MLQIWGNSVKFPYDTNFAYVNFLKYDYKQTSNDESNFGNK